MNTAIKNILVFLVFAILALFLIHPVENNDIWMHLKTGRIILEDLSITKVDDYSYTMEAKAWLNHQWLSQVIFYIFYRTFGINGIISIQFILIFSAFILLFKTAYIRNRNWLLSIFLVLLVILFSQDKFLVRPLVFSLFLFSLFIFILHRFRYRWKARKEKWLYLLIPLQILWVNLHGASILGIFLVWAYIAGEFIDSRARRKFKNDFIIKGDRYKKLLYTGILLTILTGITPYGYNAIFFPIKEFREMYFIKEWLPSVHKDILLNIGIMPYFRLFLFISIFAFIFKSRIIPSTQIIIFTALLYLSLSSRRHLALYGFAVMPFIVEYLEGLKFRKIPAHFKRPFLYLLAAGLALYLILLGRGIVTGRYYAKMGMRPRFGLGRAGFPEKGADFLLRSGLKGNMFNDYGSGCFLIWRLYPQRKVFLDGRNTIYGVRFIQRNYIDRLNNPDLFEELVKEYDINYVFLQYDLSLDNLRMIIPYLYYSKNWELVFFDDNACVFARNTTENSEIINRCRVDLHLIREYSRLDKYDWQVFCPEDHIDRALFYETAGLLNMAIETLKDALVIAPDTGDAHYNLGCLYLKKAMYEAAAGEFEKAVRINRRDVNAYNNLGIAYAELGRFKDSIEQFKKALWMSPLNQEAKRNIKLAKRDYGLHR